MSLLGYIICPVRHVAVSYTHLDVYKRQMFRGIVNSLIISGSCAVLCTYFSSLTAYGLYAYDFKLKKAAFTFIMAILVMPTQVTAMGFLRLITNMGMYLSLIHI